MNILTPQYSSPEYTDSSRAPVEFLSTPDSSDYKTDLSSFFVPIFEVNSTHYVLLKHLSELWNYPSSYQLLCKLIKTTSLSKKSFKKTDKLLNEQLGENGLIDDANVSYYYIELLNIYTSLKSKSLLAYDEEEETNFSKEKSEDATDEKNDEKISVSQVFPSYGFINSTLELKHATFNSLTNLSKFNFFKVTENYAYLPHSKLLPSELESLYNVNDYAKLEVSKPDLIIQNIKKRKPLGKPRKNATNIDVNNLELKDILIPGQGFIQEFNINHLAKVANYYIKSQLDQPPPANPAVNNSFFHIPKKNESKVSKSLSQLVFNNDFDNLSYNKYFYTKTYRGPGSGNYKDASLVNRINKIPTFSDANKRARIRHLKQIPKKKFKMHVKGLTHEKFNRSYVDHILRRQKEQVFDHENMEMLHNTLQFNLLLNTYRDISSDTWDNYYKFKSTDFEQIAEAKATENLNQQSQSSGLGGVGVGSRRLLQRFSLPQNYREITRKIPLELREDMKNPLYFNMKTSDSNNEQYLTNIDIIKLPNANMLGWDNIKKYRD